MYVCNPQFSVLEDDDAWYFVHEHGSRVATDEPVVAVWRAAHRHTLNELQETEDLIRNDDGKPIHLSRYLLTAILRILVHADLLRDMSNPAPVEKAEPAARPQSGSYPPVSIVILHRNGPEILAECLESLRCQTYPNLEVIVVDNRSTDDSREMIRKNFPEVHLVALERNLGFSAGNNAGIRRSRGDYLFILNNDTQLEPGCVAELVTAAEREPDAGVFVPKLRFYHLRKFLNGIGNHISSDNWGSDNCIGHIDLGQFDALQSVPSACFAGVMIRREVLRKVGLLDSKYFMYYEDADWSYRARLQGYRIAVAPRAVVYHRLSASSDALPSSFKLGLVVRNRLRFALKNLERPAALHFVSSYFRQDLQNVKGAVRERQWEQVGAYMRGWGGLLAMLPELVATRRKVQRKRLAQVHDDRILQSMQNVVFASRLRHGVPSLTVEDIRSYYLQLAPDTLILPATQAELAAKEWFVWQHNPNFIVNEGYPNTGANFHFRPRRSGRYHVSLTGILNGHVAVAVGDKQVGRAGRQATSNGDECNIPVGSLLLEADQDYTLTLTNTGNAQVNYIREVRLTPEMAEETTLFNDQLPDNPEAQHLVIISHDLVGKSMAGPGIRYVELARTLSRTIPVTLAAPGKTDLADERFQVQTYSDTESLQEIVAGATVILVAPYLFHKFPFLKDAWQPLVVDLYDPFTLENLEIQSKHRLVDRVQIQNNDLAVLNEQLLVGDFFICASERQRDFWIGMLSALNRLNPITYDDDKTLHRLIDIVPFGISSVRPEHTRPVLKGVYPGIEKDDIVLLWGGGLWDWLDPLTLIEAMAQVSRENPRVKLFFMGTAHPNPEVPVMDIVRRSIERSKELGLYKRSIFFNEKWVPYADRQNYLLESDLGMSLHHPFVETRFAFRTRLLDYLWADLPMVVTEGDALSEHVAKHDLGRVAPYHDAAAVAGAILELTAEPGLREEWRERFAQARDPYLWENDAAPLRAFCQSPAKAPDYQSGLVRRRVSSENGHGQIAQPAPIVVVPTPLHQLPLKAIRIARSRGLPGLSREVTSYIRWKLR